MINRFFNAIELLDTYKMYFNSGSSMNKRKDNSLGQFLGSIIWTDTLSPIQIFLKLQV